jgi:carboxyl-terminal processing protease
VILKAAETQQREEAVKGVLVGIGAELTQTNGILMIKAAMPGGPAARGGLQPGTAIVRINGISTSDMILNDAVKLLRGAQGTSVTLDLQTPSGETRRVELVREKIVIGKPEAALCAPSIGLVRLSLFNDETAAAMRGAVNELKAQGAKALILDLRGAGGGPLAAIQQVTSLFLPPGSPLWLQEQKTGERTLAKASLSANPIDMPVAVLVDGRTEAAELLAGAIRLNKRGMVIGHKTSGLAAAKDLVKNPDGSSRLVPIGSFLMSPSEPISGFGVAPDKELAAGVEPEEFIRTAVTELRKELGSGSPR